MSPLLGLILIPIVGAAFAIVGPNPRKTAIFAAALNFLGAIALFGMCKPNEGFQFLSTFPLLPQLGIGLTLGADGLSVAMLLLSAAVTLAAVCVARSPQTNANWFYGMLLFISAGAIGAFASVDAFFFYMFHELALIPTFLLIGIWGSGDRQAAAWKATIYLGLGSFVLLLGIIGLYLAMPGGQRTFDLQTMQALAADGSLKPPHWVYWTLLLGFGTLISLFPFHSWAPQAYASAPTPASMLHAGVLKKFGLYGILRLVVPIFPHSILVTRIPLGFGWSISYLDLFLVMIVGNLLYIGLVTIAQKRLDWTLGYSSVMHMGYIFLGIAAFNQLSLSGAAVLMVAHGLSIAALFALSGALRERTGTLDYAELGGLAKPMPLFGLLFGFATMASVGLPGFANFPGELMVFFGSFGTSAEIVKSGLSSIQIVTVIAVWGVVISAVYMLRAYRNVFFGTMPARWANLPDLATVPRYAVILLILLLLGIGFHPQLLLSYVTPAILLP